MCEGLGCNEIEGGGGCARIHDMNSIVSQWILLASLFCLMLIGIGSCFLIDRFKIFNYSPIERDLFLEPLSSFLLVCVLVPT